MKSISLNYRRVLTYAMCVHSRRSNLFTDYTFGLWNEEKTELVTFAKVEELLEEKTDAFKNLKIQYNSERIF